MKVLYYVRNAWRNHDRGETTQDSEEDNAAFGESKVRVGSLIVVVAMDWTPHTQSVTLPGICPVQLAESVFLPCRRTLR